MLLYSGHEDGNTPCTRRVALMLSKVTRNALVGWESHGSRIIKASFKTKKEGITINVIQCYAPTNYSDGDDKDQSYEFEVGRREVLRKRSTILIGDQNSKSGMDNTGYEDIIGRHGLRERKR
ncbi:unnamed protein product [Schistosoma margrebowiei]|uniref:Uncharacterized protein n=1 Tax=Schistosoma margrebowiei TaxID=48269 RepID=A0A183MWH3_9TREM|nr:unnamed protein product [Schistosoma margrebowiei]